MQSSLIICDEIISLSEIAENTKKYEHSIHIDSVTLQKIKIIDYGNNF